jgi:predicted secreted Zn-dependent protease
MRGIWLLVALAPLAQAAEPVTSTVREQHYLVYGRTIAEIRRSISERTPVRNAHGAFGGGTKTHYNASYRLVPVSETQCVLKNAAVKAESLVTLPRLAPGTLPPAVSAEWRRYYLALRTHEYQHVDSAKASARVAQQWLAGLQLSGPCHAVRPRVRAAIEARIRMLDERDRLLDSMTDHGRSQGAELDERVR